MELTKEGYTVCTVKILNVLNSTFTLVIHTTNPPLSLTRSSHSITKDRFFHKPRPTVLFCSMPKTPLLSAFSASLARARSCVPGTTRVEREREERMERMERERRERGEREE